MTDPDGMIKSEQELLALQPDEELVMISREGDGRATDLLMERYKEMVRSRAHSMFLIGGDEQDLIQEGMIGLFQAVRDYDSGRDASFRTFAGLCVERKLYSAVRDSSRKKHAPLNSAVPFEQAGYYTGAEQTSAGHPASEEADPAQILLHRESYRRLQSEIRRRLSPLESQVLDLHMTGLAYTEIARVLGRQPKATDNALQRARAKVRALLEETEDQ
jgi:RNA polymerase sporulation-specific sigma factor